MDGYRAVFGDLGALIALSWPWCVIFMLTIYGLDLGLGMPSFGISDTFGVFVSVVVSVFGSTVFLVNWNRRVLLREPATGFSVLRAGRREERHLGTGILFLLVLYASVFVSTEVLFWLYSPVFGDELAWLLDRLAGPAILLLIFALGARFSLAFPIVALDGPRYPLIVAWRLSRGQTLRLMAGLFLTTIPAFVVSRTILNILNTTLYIPGMVVPLMGLTLAAIVMHFVHMALIFSFLCQAYAHLTGHSAPRQPAGP